jgi:UDP-2,3-diacylglucosamine pyrophosphatase LpxH
VQTDKRLTDAYKNAQVAYIDEKSKYVIMSDCHRGDGSVSDEFTRNQNIFMYALDHYYKNDFVYVEAGDGDELWEHHQFKHIKNAHFDIFKIIKKFHSHNRLVMLYGNHNIYLKKTAYVQKNYFYYYHEHHREAYDFLKGLEPCEALVLKHKDTAQEILIVHGHQGDFTNDQFWVPSMLSLKYFWRFLHAFGIRNPASPVKNVFKRHRIERNYNKWIQEHKTALICGHTHRFKYPRKNELPYFNSGCCIYPAGITAIEIEDGNIQMVVWRIKVNGEGVLQVKRYLLRGPAPIENFDIRQSGSAQATPPAPTL